MRSTIVIVLAIAGAAAAPHAAAAQPQDASASAPVSAPDAPDAPGAAPLLREVYAHYRSLDRYTATVTSVTDMHMSGRAAGGMEQEMSQHIDFRFARPDRLYYESDQMIIVADGEHLSFGMPMMLQYVRQEMSDGVEWQRLLPSVATGGDGAARLLDVSGLLTHEAADVDALLEALASVVVTTREDDGARRVLVTADLSGDVLPMGAGGPAIALEIEIDPVQKLVTRQRMDMTEAANRMMAEMAEAQPNAAFGGMRYERLVMTSTLEAQRLDPELDAGDFTFDWEEQGYELADADTPFASMLGGASTSPLIGAPAPAIEGETLGGEPFDLAELRGEVVVLDFWATWCGPCVQALPKIQSLHEHFQGRPVRVVGINQDRGNLDAVGDFLERKAITFGHVYDAGGRIGRAYEVSGIPTTVLIDREGVVQAVHVGLAPGAERTLREQVETLLDGGTLVTDKQREAAAEARERTADVRELEAREDTGSSREHALEPIAPERLSLVETLGGHGQAARLDLDGDGRDELLLPSQRANFTIVRADGSTDPLRLQGVPRQQVGVVRVVDAGEGRRDLVFAATLASMSGGTRLMYGRWRSDGTRIWSSEVAGEGRSTVTPVLATGDVSGDGRAEIVLGLYFMTYDSSGSSRDPGAMTSYVGVYDLDGTCLVQREVGRWLSGIEVLELEDGGAAIYLQTDRGTERFEFDAEAGN